MVCILADFKIIPINDAVISWIFLGMGVRGQCEEPPCKMRGPGISHVMVSWERNDLKICQNNKIPIVDQYQF